MIHLQTQLEGKRAVYGHISDDLCNHGYCLGSNWDYYQGSFDSVLHSDNGETIYLRLPFAVTTGKLDHPHATIQFQRPYIVKHVVNLGIDNEANSLLDATGLSQFQAPLDTDGQIRNKSRWESVGEEEVNRILDYLH